MQNVQGKPLATQLSLSTAVGDILVRGLALLCFGWLGLVPLTFAQQLTSPPSSSHTPVTVFIRDGRTLTGYVDRRTDDGVLWLRFIRDAVALTTGFTWDLIERVDVGDEQHSPQSFRQIAARFASEAPAVLPPSTSGKPVRMSTTRRRSLPPVNPPSNRIRSLEVEAQVDNWNRDAESDGIALRVAPRTYDGRVLPVEGIISVQLVGRNFVNGDDAEAFPLLGQWSQRVRAVDFDGSWGAVYRLSAPLNHDDNQAILAVGMVEARLNVFGQGDFEAVAPVHLRTYNPIRDQLDQHRMRYDAYGRYRARHW